MKGLNLDIIGAAGTDTLGQQGYRPLYDRHYVQA